MGPAAHVTETEALVELRAQLCAFADQSKDALGIIGHEIQRTFSFLDERLHEWHAAVRQSEDEVMQAKIELSQRRNQRIGVCGIPGIGSWMHGGATPCTVGLLLISGKLTCCMASR